MQEVAAPSCYGALFLTASLARVSPWRPMAICGPLCCALAPAVLRPTGPTLAQPAPPSAQRAAQCPHTRDGVERDALVQRHRPVEPHHRLVPAVGKPGRGASDINLWGSQNLEECLF